MKKIVCTLLAICLVVPSLALAKGKAKDEPIPDFCKPILEAWNATTAEELLLSILECQKNDSPEEPPASFTPKYRPCNIRFGGTTQELIKDKKNWDLAIVSSKAVDLQKLASEGLIMQTYYNPAKYFATNQWLVPEKLQLLLPNYSSMLYYVYYYDYQEQTNDATLLICQADIGQKKNHPRTPYLVAFELMKRRSAAEARSVEGIYRVENWTEEDLLTRVDEWDVATIIIDADDRLIKLDEAGLLYDFSQDSYFHSRAPIRPFAPSIIKYGDKPYHELPNGIFSDDGRMIGIPTEAVEEDRYTGLLGVTIMNAKSPFLKRAYTYVAHYIKSLEWFWIYADNDNNSSISKDKMDW